MHVCPLNEIILSFFYSNKIEKVKFSCKKNQKILIGCNKAVSFNCECIALVENGNDRSEFECSTSELNPRDL